ncbi:GH92 family glycosyl hydrolase [Solilutibacter silvestris]|uniref:Putative alpha-1,2-mannosidase n=1 Tax=Solilutibacter silvestris TaxID=1645665 RepID=A0A2K1Q1C6_9GAMM|nr:GH92 family glycosyl hydrolase [Lysobacter silvestris]PNS08727.1 putative alpha-1,2-mannosidase [Lysobacter silvestris]
MRPIFRPSSLRHSFATFIAGLALTSTVMIASAQTRTPLAASVNTLIGTQDEGNTFPGAAAPFGMIQASPIGSHYAGWRYGDDKILGIGHSFISGAGCWEQGGQVSVLPVTGTIAPGGAFDTKDAKSFDQKHYGARYTIDAGGHQAGYFKARLTDYGGIDIETTALPRASSERYTWAPGADTGHVLVNVAQANAKHRVIGSQVRVVGDRAVEGKITTLSFCGGHQYSTWFRIEFDRPFTAFGVWGQAGGTAGARFSMESEYEPFNGAWVSFGLKDGRSVTATTAISHVDIEGARNNLRAEGLRDGKPITFDAMRMQAQQTWDKELSSIRIDGASTDDRSVFYTALYHAFLQPMTGSDADGRYRGYDDRIHRADGWTYYEYFSLWDTYRAQNQLLALLRPQRARDIGRTLLAIDAQNGWLPRWGYANFDTNTMTGDPVTPFLVDLWRYGALKGMEGAAWTALRKNAWEVPPLTSRSEGRAGNANYIAHGFILFDRTFPAKGMDVDPQNAGSATMEYALSDCALAQMAQSLGHPDDANTLRTRAGNWRNLWDATLTEPESSFVGFPHPKMEGGDWFIPPNGHYSPRSHYGFHEGTSWQYQWLVPQDVAALAQAMGGREQMGKRLDAFFAWDEIGGDPQAARKAWVNGAYAYYGQYRFNPNNEPTMHVPSLYSLIGQPWKTDGVLRAAQTLFTNAPNGVTGNDDLGTMSAWYLFTTLGFSPLMQGTGEVLLHAPRYPRITIDLGDGRTLRVEAPTAKPGAQESVAAVKFDGKPVSNVWMNVDALRKGGTLQFALTPTPDRNGWGTHPQDAPPSACPVTQ